MARRKRQAGEAGPWDDFARRHHGNTFLGQNPLYALPEALIDALAREMPDFWTEAEAAFEHDLTRTAGGGFFHRRPFPSPLGPPPIDARQQRTAETIRQLQAEDMTSAGRSDLQVRRHFDAVEAQQAAADLRAAAFTGWLVSNPQFLAERDLYRRDWEARVAAAGRFPAHRLSVFGEQPQQPVGRDEALLLHFYRRWGLDGFLTWDLPAPMRPQVATVIYHDTGSLAGAGLHLFLPWYLLRDQSLSLRDLARQHQATLQPEHLQGWLTPQPAGRKALGYQRLRNVLVLFCGWTLALRGRYAGRLASKTECLDRAFASHLRLSTDSVKKLRLGLGHPPAGH
jgi:hypothetical protein